MKLYSLGLYEKSMPDVTWKEKMETARDAGYDFLEMCIDATDEKINRIHWSPQERLSVIKDMYETGLPIRSMSVSALTKYAIGDEDDSIRQKAMDIALGSITLAHDLGVRVVMLPGYDIYFGESTTKTKDLFVENIARIAHHASALGVLCGFETMENDFMNTVAKSLKYVYMTGSPYLKIYPDMGNITNGNLVQNDSVERDLRLGAGNIVALHLKESKPGIFREVPYGTGHVDFEMAVKTAKSIGVNRFVTEFWYVGSPTWKQDVADTCQRFTKLIKGIYEA